jgi:hypothetical protein
LRLMQTFRPCGSLLMACIFMTKVGALESSPGHFCRLLQWPEACDRGMIPRNSPGSRASILNAARCCCTAARHNESFETGAIHGCILAARRCGSKLSGGNIHCGSLTSRIAMIATKDPRKGVIDRRARVMRLAELRRPNCAFSSWSDIF